MLETVTRRRTKLGAWVLLAAFARDARAAETWLHPVLPAVGVKTPVAPRRRGGAARVDASSAPRPFPAALSGDSSTVELTTGERFPEPGGAIEPARIDRSWVRLGSARPLPLMSAKVDGPLTRLEATWAGQGLATLGVLLVAEPRTMEAAAFESFLREAGETAALAERTKKKETKKAAKVVAVESARAFAAVLPPPRAASPVDPAAGTDEPLGLPLEIVSAVPPLPIRTGGTLTVALLVDGKPAPGALLRAYAPWSATPLSVVADAQGLAALPLEGEGRLLLAAAHVRRTAKADRARGEAWKKADWEVRRTTLELLVLPKAAPAPAPTRAPKRKAPPRAKPR